MRYAWIYLTPNPDGSLRQQNETVENLGDLPDGSWVLPGGMKPALIDERKGTIYAGLPRFNVEEIRTIIQIIQPRFAAMNDTVYWYMDLVPRLIDVINDAQKEKNREAAVEENKPESIIIKP